MKTEDQVCTAQQGKILVELGINAEPLFWHCVDIDPITPKCILQSWQHSNFSECEKYPAFTVAELGVMLPNEAGVLCTSSYYNDHMGAWYAEAQVWPSGEEDNDNTYNRLADEEADTEATARAALLIWLLENNHTTAEECNNRLRA